MQQRIARFLEVEMRFSFAFRIVVKAQMRQAGSPEGTLAAICTIRSILACLLARVEYGIFCSPPI